MTIKKKEGSRKKKTSQLCCHFSMRGGEGRGRADLVWHHMKGGGGKDSKGNHPGEERGKEIRELPAFL